MGDYEQEQERLNQLWDELMSDEDTEPSIIDNVYSSDGYTPGSHVSSDTENEDSDSFLFVPKRRKKLPEITTDSGASTSKANNSCASSNVEELPNNSQTVPGVIVTELDRGHSPNIQPNLTTPTPSPTLMSNVENVIEDVISKYTQESDSENENNQDDLSNLQWNPVDGSSFKIFDFDGNGKGIKANIYEEYISKDPYDFFKLFVCDEIVTLMVNETNLYAEQWLAKEGLKPKSRIKKWTPTDSLEMERFLGILLWMGLFRLPTIRSYWKTTALYNNKISRLMSRNRFELLLKMWHFSNNNDNALADDRLRKITPLLEKIVQNFKKVSTPGKKVCIDETMVPFRGRLRFRQYIKNKRHKFGIKLYKLCTENGYTSDVRVYCGTDVANGGQASSNVVFALMDDLLDSGRELYTDNYYTSVSLATKLLKRKTHLVGTLRSNRKYNPKEVVQKKLKPKEVYAKESDSGIMVMKWRDKRDVLMLSTLHKDNTKEAPQRGGPVEKPEAIISYNSAKSYIDLSDQVKSYSHCLRRGTKWYRKLATELLLGSAIVNAILVYKEVTMEKLSITEFKEKLCHSLLRTENADIENVEPENNDENSDENHALELTDSRLRCVVCYENLKKSDGRKAAINKSARSKWLCSVCKKHYCVQCFFTVHSAKKL